MNEQPIKRKKQVSFPYTQVGAYLRNEEYKTIFHNCKDYTMIPERRFIINLLLANQVCDLPGSIVETGVWRGGMIAGLSYFLGADREFFLFDSFEGLPPAQPIDGERAIIWQQDVTSPKYFDNCSASSDFAREIMEKSGAKNYHIVPGWFEETVPEFSVPEPIALLRLDGDWYDSTMICLDYLFDQVAKGGIIIIDDYFVWDGCSRAVHDFLSKRSSIERIQAVENVCYIKKIAEPILKNAG